MNQTFQRYLKECCLLLQLAWLHNIMRLKISDVTFCHASYCTLLIVREKKGFLLENLYYFQNSLATEKCSYYYFSMVANISKLLAK